MSFNLTKKSNEGFVQALDGIKRKTLVYGDKTLMVEFDFDEGCDLPMHSHPHEQTGYLVSGHIVLNIDGEKYDVNPGDAWTIEGNAMHGAKALEDSVAIEIFSPVREDYIPE